jgi:DNA-directed RNA polymerase specialized sigma24 family protein
VVGVPEAPEAYLARAVRNEVASHFRRRGRERTAVGRLEAGHADRSAEVIALEREGVRLLLSALPTADRRTFALRGLADLPFDEIARELQLQPVSVRSRVRRTRRRTAPA